MGLGLVVAAWLGRAWSLVVLGVLFASTIALAEVIDVPFDAGAGDRRVVVDTRGELADTHELFAGGLTLDLRRAPLTDGTSTMEAAVGMGTLRVIVPRDASVEVDARVKAGNIDGDLAPTPDEGGVDLHETFNAGGRERVAPTSASTCGWGSARWRSTVPRHRFDPVALVFGAVFVAAGLIVLAGGELIDEGRALVPAGLIALGVALLVHVTRRARPSAPAAAVAQPATDTRVAGRLAGTASTHRPPRRRRPRSTPPRPTPPGPTPPRSTPPRPTPPRPARPTSTPPRWSTRPSDTRGPSRNERGRQLASTARATRSVPNAVRIARYNSPVAAITAE